MNVTIPGAEGELRDQIQERLRRFFRQTITARATDNHLELEDTGEDALQLMVSVEDLGDLVRNFVASLLSTCPAAERELSIEMFAFFFPAGLTIEEQGDIGAVLEESLRDYQLPQALADIFFASIPTAMELVDYLVFSPIANDDDPTVPVYDLPSWFDPTTVILRETKARPPPTYGPEIPGYQVMNELDDWLHDLYNIADGLYHVNRKFLSMANDEPDTYDRHARERARTELHLASNDLGLILLPVRGDLSLVNIPMIRAGLENAESILVRAVDRIFVGGEAWLNLQEQWFLTTEDKKFKGYASRYERTKARYYLKYLISHLLTPRLRSITLPHWPQVAREGPRPREGDEKCPICHEDLPEDGEIATPPMVTYKCCRRAFHVDCLLDWLFSKIPDTRMDCPMCRAEIDLDTLGEILEVKTLDMAVL